MKKIILLTLPLMAMCLASCKKDASSYFAIYTSEYNKNIDAFGGRGYVVQTFILDGNINDYQSNVSVTCNESWCHYNYKVSMSYWENRLRFDVRIDYQLESNETGKTRNVTFLIQIANEQDKIEISQPGAPEIIIPTPGSLIQELADKDLLYATSLKISGELNDEDLEAIKELRKIETLDLRKAIIDDLLDEMFYQNETIKSIKLPETITTIHPKTFAFSSLEYIYFPSNIEVIEDGEINNNSYDWRYSGAFANTNLRTIEFAPDSRLRYIGDYAFVGAGEENHFDVGFPASVEEIGYGVFNVNSKGIISRAASVWIAFDKDSKLTSIGSINTKNISIDASNCTKVEYVGSLNNCFSVKIGTQNPPQCGDVSGDILYVPKGCVGAYYVAAGWKEFNRIKEIGQE